MMKSKSLVSVCFMVLALATAGLAWAGGLGECPAVSSEKCGEAGGAFTSEDGLKQCVITGEAQPVLCQLPTHNPFSVLVATTTTFTKEDGQCHETSSSEIVGCLNGQGHQVSVNACASKECPTQPE